MFIYIAHSTSHSPDDRNIAWSYNTYDPDSVRRRDESEVDGVLRLGYIVQLEALLDQFGAGAANEHDKIICGANIAISYSGEILSLVQDRNSHFSECHAALTPIRRLEQLPPPASQGFHLGKNGTLYVHAKISGRRHIPTTGVIKKERPPINSKLSTSLDRRCARPKSAALMIPRSCLADRYFRGVAETG